MKFEDAKQKIDKYFEESNPIDLRLEVVSIPSYHVVTISNEVYNKVGKDLTFKEVEEMSVLELIQFLIKNGFGIEEFKINKLENL